MRIQILSIARNYSFILRLLMRNLEQKSGVGSGLSNNSQDPFRSVDLKKALTDTVVELNAAFGRFWENRSLSFVPQPLKSSGAACAVPQRVAKGVKDVTPGSTATIALIRDGYELVVAQVRYSIIVIKYRSDVSKISSINL